MARLRNLLLVKMKEKKLLKIQPTKSAACASYKSIYVTYNCYIHYVTYNLINSLFPVSTDKFITKSTKFITGQNEREETTQDAIVTKSAAFASYEITGT
jgi:hypothetical protein